MRETLVIVSFLLSGISIIPPLFEIQELARPSRRQLKCSLKQFLPKVHSSCFPLPPSTHFVRVRRHRRRLPQKS